MATVSYSKSSPWGSTPINNGGFLDFFVDRNIPAHRTDTEFKVTGKYANRPDMLANDYYGTPKLWWVFARRNVDVIKDPLRDMTEGKKIMLPEKTRLLKLLGV